MAQQGGAGASCRRWARQHDGTVAKRSGRSNRATLCTVRMISCFEQNERASGAKGAAAFPAATSQWPVRGLRRAAGDSCYRTRLRGHRASLLSRGAHRASRPPRPPRVPLPPPTRARWRRTSFTSTLPARGPSVPSLPIHPSISWRRRPCRTRCRAPPPRGQTGPPCPPTPRPTAPPSPCCTQQKGRLRARMARVPPPQQQWRRESSASAQQHANSRRLAGRCLAAAAEHARTRQRTWHRLCRCLLREVALKDAAVEVGLLGARRVLRVPARWRRQQAEAAGGGSSSSGGIARR